MSTQGVAISLDSPLRSIAGSGERRRPRGYLGKQHETIGAGSPFRLAIAIEIARSVVCRLGILVYSLK